MPNIPYKAVGDIVLVAIKSAEEKSKGGIILPQDNVNKMTEAATEGVMISCGSKVFDFLDDDAVDTPAVGDNVIFTKYAGVRINEDNELEEYRLIRDKDILGIKEKAETVND